MAGEEPPGPIPRGTRKTGRRKKEIPPKDGIVVLTRKRGWKDETITALFEGLPFCNGSACKESRLYVIGLWPENTIRDIIPDASFDYGVIGTDELPAGLF